MPGVAEQPPGQGAGQDHQTRHRKPGTIRSPPGRRRVASTIPSATISQATTRPIRNTTGSFQGTDSGSLTALSTMPDTNPATAVQAAIPSIRWVTWASLSRLGILKPCVGACLRESRPA